MRLSFIIPWFDRPELGTCLLDNQELFQSLDCELIVVNAGGSPTNFSRILSSAKGVKLSGLTITGATFTKSLCLNIGVSRSNSDYLFLLDADVILSRRVIKLSTGKLRSKAFVTIRRGVETDPNSHPHVLRIESGLSERLNTTKFLFPGGESASIEFWNGRHGRCMPGLMLLRKADFLAVQGCNSDLQGWGFEDYDLQIRLQAYLGLKRVSLGTARHITHNIDSKEMLRASDARNRAACFENYRRRNFFGTYAVDIERWSSHAIAIAGPCDT